MRSPLAVLLLAMSLPAFSAPFPDFEQSPARAALPDPLVMADGTRLTLKEEWLERRVPELQELFQHYEYGHFPPAPAHVEARVEREDPAALGGKATIREVALTWGMPEVTIHLLLVLPHLEKPAPVFLGLSFASTHEALEDPHLLVSPAWRHGHEHDPRGSATETAEASRGKQKGVWNIERTVERGYAVALFYNGDVVPDYAPAALERLKQFRPAERAEAPAPDDCATLAAWAWGLMRAVDYLVTAPGIDPHRIAVVGHSRNGKTALLAGAFDSRIALVIPSQAGCGGTAPCRVGQQFAGPEPQEKPTMETVWRITHAFPHWFNGVFASFAAAPERLPIDQHELIALCAPRPVLVSAATEDLWANPSGQFAMLRAANPAYRLLAGEGVAATEMPAPRQLLSTRLGFFLRPGKHEMNEEDWSAWLDYADRWLK